MAKSTILNSVEEVIEDFRNGRIVIVVDDEDRENEGDFIVAAEKITPEIVNFMLKEGRGVLCAPLSEERCAELGLNMMEENNTSLLGTPFTVTVDLLGNGCTTGVSIHDRAATIRALADPATRATDLGRPGHINPLRARQKGVLRRPGHTEAAIDLARLAGLQPAGALIEIMNEDGTMARLPQLTEIARKFGLKIISIASLIEYRLREESIVEKGETVDLPTAWGDFRITPFRQKSNGLEHVALTKGEWTEDEPVLTRVHSSCATGDIFGSCRCDCGDQLHEAMRMIEREGKGAIIYLQQGHINPLRARQKGVLRRPGHTEAAIDLARLAGLQPAGALIEIMNEDGTMARLPQLTEIARKFGLKIISIASLIEYRLREESIVEKGETVDLPTAWGDFRITPFRQKSNGLEHVALTKGEWTEDEPVLTRVHSSCATGDIFGSCRCDCGDQLHEAMRMIEREGKGAIIYLQQEGRGIGLCNKIKAYKLQDEGLDTVDANVRLGFGVDERDYGVGASIIREMGIKHMRLMTNNPLKRAGLEGYGLKIDQIVPIVIAPNEHNLRYLKTKEQRMHHTLGLDKQ